MPIKIEQMNVKDLGPISTFTQEFKRVSLVFGHNEMGKTSLVEFMIKSLFRNPKQWPLREFSGTGKVLVSGLSDGVEEFNPASARKLESYWEESALNFPQDLSRLLVVRAAEVALTEDKNGVDAAILKQYLSGVGVLDQILDNIPATIQDATIQNKTITGANRGDIKRIREFERRYAVLVDLEKRINEQLSEGELLNLRKKAEGLGQELSLLESARRYRAYAISKEIDTLEKKIAKYPGEVLEDASNKMSNWMQLNSILKEEEEQLETAREETVHLDWLRQAKEIFEARQGRAVPKFYIYFLIAGMVMVAGSLFALFYYQHLLAFIIAFVLGMAFFGYYVYALNKINKNKNDVEDIEGIEKGYAEKFGEKFHGLADLAAKIEHMRTFEARQELLEGNIRDRKNQLNELRNDITNLVKRFYPKKFTLDKVEKIIREAKTYVESLEKKQNAYCQEQAVLQVEPADFLENEPEVEWNLKNYEDFSTQQEGIFEQISAIEGQFTDLKQSARDIAGTDMGDDWEEIIWDIQQNIIEAEKDLNSLQTRCMAQVILTGVVKEQQVSEDEKIKEGLRSPEIVESIQKITKKYSDIDYQDGTIYLKDKFGSYALNELSTGTIEQVFLSLRMGFAARAAGDNKLFLILDDAFQYSDWDRRPQLVDMVFGLAKEGWQIIYFSMDDHIRDLFAKKAEKTLKDEFLLIEI